MARTAMMDCGSRSNRCARKRLALDTPQRCRPSENWRRARGPLRAVLPGAGAIRGEGHPGPPHSLRQYPAGAEAERVKVPQRAVDPRLAGHSVALTHKGSRKS